MIRACGRDHSTETLDDISPRPTCSTEAADTVSPTPTCTHLSTGRTAFSSSRWAYPSSSGRAPSGARGCDGVSEAGLVPHPDSFGAANPAVDFGSVLPPQGLSAELELDTIRLSCWQLRPSRLLTEGCPLLLAVLLTSLVSFAFVAVSFRFALSLPSPPGEAHEGWTTCTASGAAVTELGRRLPFHKVRAAVSLPKFYDIAAMTSLIGWLMSGLNSVVRALLLMQLTIATAAVPPYLIVRAMPTVVDPLISYTMVALACAVGALWLVRSRQSSSRVVSRCPKLLFFLGFAILFGFGVALHNLLGRLTKLGVQPGLVVGVAIVLVRGMSFVVRQLLKGLQIRILACFSMLFAFDVAMLTALRRYWLGLPSLADVAISAAVNAVVELLFNTVAVAYAISSYNAFVEQGRVERASVQINIFFASVVSKLIAEHVALHGSLGYNLFVDPRVLSVIVAHEGANVLEGWVLSCAFEVAVDMVTVVPMILFFPVSVRHLLVDRRQSLPAALFVLVGCVHPHLVGLHTYLERDRYFCA